MRLRGPDGIVEASLAGVEVLADGSIRTPEGTFRVEVARDGDAVWVSHDGFTATYARAGGVTREADRDLRAPMTGRVVAVNVKKGDTVATGAVLVILEAMKMEYRVEAPSDGVVDVVDVLPGSQVELGQTLVTLV